MKQLTILGVGLLGGSIGLAVRAADPTCKIVGFGHRPQTLQKAQEIGAIDRAETDPAAAVAGSDLVILCTPVGAFEDILRKIAPALAPGCLLTDVGSTKRSVVKLAHSILKKGTEFVASHPIAGSEKRGVEYARTDLFRHHLCIVTPTPATPPAALHRALEFWQLLEMRVVQLSPEDHDRLMADVSHLPHLLAAALVAMQEEQSLDFCGRGFLDTTRIAAGDAALWRDILLDNADNLRSGVARLQEQLRQVMTLLEAKDREPLRQWLAAAAERREKIVERKLRTQKD
ncbi:MAG: prephenate dehydrogenase [Tepidisphaeraceae bacterium]|jgi:prephenate dehydrogenase